MALVKKKPYKPLQKAAYKPLNHFFLIIPLTIEKIIKKIIKPKTTLSEEAINAPGLGLNQKFQVKKFPIIIIYTNYTSFKITGWAEFSKFSYEDPAFAG